MARDYNKVILMGRLARDPDVRFTPSKQKVARMTVATGRQWKNKATGEQQSHTDFISIVAWGFVADICEKYLKKGRQLLVEGRISVRDYDDVKTGTRKWVTEVIAENVVLLGSKQQDDTANPYVSSGKDGYSEAGQATEVGFDEEFPLDFSGQDIADADIPF